MTYAYLVGNKTYKSLRLNTCTVDYSTVLLLLSTVHFWDGRSPRRVKNLSSSTVRYRTWYHTVKKQFFTQVTAWCNG